MDLAGIALAGVLGGLAISGVASRQPGNRVQGVLNSLQLEQFTLQQQALILKAEPEATANLLVSYLTTFVANTSVYCL
jgi:hypothetical protein